MACHSVRAGESPREVHVHIHGAKSCLLLLIWVCTLHPALVPKCPRKPSLPARSSSANSEPAKIDIGEATENDVRALFRLRDQTILEDET